MLDRETLAAMAVKGPPAVFATISGAHLYGFASADSDVDLRGAFLRPVEDVLGLHPSPETISVEDKSVVDLDWVAHDLRKFAKMMTQHNGYVLEQLYSPLVVLTSPAHEELRALGRGCITRPVVRHYRGFARGRRKRLGEPNPTVKHLLYAYRVLLTGVHVMRTGRLVMNVSQLNETFGIAAIDELVRRKREGSEKMALSAQEVRSHDGTLEKLERELMEAHDASELPDEPTSMTALDAFVVRIRLAGL